MSQQMPEQISEQCRREALAECFPFFDLDEQETGWSSGGNP